MESYYHEIEYLKDEKSFKKALCTTTPQQSEAADDASQLIDAAMSIPQGLFKSALNF